MDIRIMLFICNNTYNFTINSFMIHWLFILFSMSANTTGCFLLFLFLPPPPHCVSSLLLPIVFFCLCLMGYGTLRYEMLYLYMTLQYGTLICRKAASPLLSDFVLSYCAVLT